MTTPALARAGRRVEDTTERGESRTDFKTWWS